MYRRFLLSLCIYFCGVSAGSFAEEGLPDICAKSLEAQSRAKIKAPYSVEEAASQTIQDSPAFQAFSQIEKINHKARLEFVADNFRRSGVQFKHRRIFLFFPALCLETSGSARLNVIARRMFEGYQTGICYVPALRLGEDSSLGWQFGRYIGMSDLSAISGRPDLTLFHEINHASNSRRRGKLAQLFAAKTYFFPFARKLKKRAGLYNTVLAQDEALAWRLEQRIGVRSAKWLSAKGSVTDAEFETLNQNSTPELSGIYASLKILNYEADRYPGLVWNSVSRGGIVCLWRLDFRGMITKTILPDPLIKNALPGGIGTSPREKRAFFNTRAGRILAKSVEANVRRQRLTYLDEAQREFTTLDPYRDTQIWMSWYPPSNEVRGLAYGLAVQEYVNRIAGVALTPIGWAKMPLPFLPKFDVDAQIAAPSNYVKIISGKAGMPFSERSDLWNVLQTRDAEYRHVKLKFQANRRVGYVHLELIPNGSQDPPLADVEILISQGWSLLEAEIHSHNTLENHPYRFFELRNKIRMARLREKLDYLSPTR